MVSPTTSAAGAMVNELVAIVCPVDRAVAASRIAEDFGNLPPVIAKIRRDALQEARDAGRRVKDIADLVSLTRCRIYQLTTTRRRGRVPGTGVSDEASVRVQSATPSTPFPTTEATTA